MDSSFHEYLKAVIIDPSESPQQWITKIRKRKFYYFVFMAFLCALLTLAVGYSLGQVLAKS